MEQSDYQYATVPRAVFNFLQHTLPFNGLEETTLESLSSHCWMDFFPRGTLIFKQDVTEVTHVHLIQTGGVKVYLSGQEKVVTLKEYGGKGQSFGTAAVVNSRKAQFNVEAVEDTFCLLIDKNAFLDVFKQNPRFARHYDSTVSEEVMLAAYSEQRLEKVSARSEETFYLFNSRVVDMIKEPPVTVDASATVQEVGALMAEQGLTCVLVKEPSGSVLGTVTNHDLRAKVVAKGLDYGAGVTRIMGSPVQTVPAVAFSFEAVMTMMEKKVDHLAVLHNDEIIGVLSGPDMMVHLGSSPLFLFRDISGQRTVEGLHDLAKKVPVIVRSLVEAGAKAGNISQMITVFSDTIIKRILELIERDMGRPPSPYDWLGMGSEGRKEQTFKTDQDNGLVYAEPDDPSREAEAHEYFQALANSAVDNLEKSGFPRCRNDFMASNPRWRAPWSGWRNCFDEWMANPMPPDIYLSTIFFDFRSVAGNGSLANMLRTRVEMKARQSPRFLKYFARYFLLNAPPLSFYLDSVVEKDGAHSGELDLKTRGVTPFVDFARIFALLHGIRETNTLARLLALSNQGHIPDDLFSDAWHAYEYNLHLMLVHQLRMVEEGRQPDNIMRPADLSDLEKKTLKFSFSVIERLMDFVKRGFNVAPASRSHTRLDRIGLR